MAVSEKKSKLNLQEFRLNIEETEKFYELTYRVFHEWHSAVVAAISRPSFYVPRYSGYPEISEKVDNFPKVYTMWQSKTEVIPHRYSCLLPYGGDAPMSLLSPTKKVIIEDQSTTFKELVDWILCQKNMLSFFESPVEALSTEKVARDTIGNFLARSIEISIWQNEKKEASETHFRSAFDFFARAILLKNICISAIVPILGITFPIQRFRLTETSFLIRMSSHLQKSRSVRRDYSGNTDDSLAQLATHALVLRKWNIKNDNLIKTRFDLRQQFPEILNRVECFFGILRTVNPTSTGYSQVLYRPEKIDTGGFADLLSLHGILLRRYPTELSELKYTSKPVQKVSHHSLQEIKELIGSLEKLKENSIYLAVRRLNQCFEREEGDDSLIDAAIGIELLLGDSNSEATSYKLRMRAAALAKVSGNRFSALGMKKRVEELYKARSKLVHGRPPKGSVSLIKNNDTHRADVVAARNVLRDLIWTLTETPKYLNVENIEADLMLS